LLEEIAMAAQMSQPRKIEEFEEDSRWFHDNISSLRKKNYGGKFVAIKNKKVISSDEKIEGVISSLEKKGENTSYVVVEFVYPEGTVILL
jgi:hypothetical protein